MGSMKNFELLPIGTRVKLAYDKLSTRVGTVVEHSDEREDTMVIYWDGDPEYRLMGYSIAEVRKVRNGEDTAL